MKPNLYIVTDATWPTYVGHETNAAYERYGILPGAFLDDRDQDQDKWVVYASEKMARQAFMQSKTDTGKPWNETGEGLFEHECLHAWTGFDHPTTIWLGIKHAIKCGLDTRAFTRLLRWNWNKANHKKFKAWIGAQRAAWDAGIISAKPAPKV